MIEKSFNPPRKLLRSHRIGNKLPQFGPKWLNFDAAACKNDKSIWRIFEISPGGTRKLIVQHFKPSSFRKIQVILSFLFLHNHLGSEIQGGKAGLIDIQATFKLLKHPGTLATASCFEYMVTECLHIRRPFVSRAQNSTSPNSELWEVV